MKLWHWIGLFLFVIWVGSSFAPDDPPKRSSSSSDRSNATSPASGDPTPSTSASQPAKIRLYVTGNVVNVRSGPGTSYARVTQLKRSDEAQEISRQNGWVEISFSGGRGWMFGKYLSPTRPRAPSPPSPPPPVKKAPQQRRCHPSYSGACVPIASDVDCAGGSGNGPAYVRGPVRVIGRDVYRLDRDKDGVGCE